MTQLRCFANLAAQRERWGGISRKVSATPSWVEHAAQSRQTIIKMADRKTTRTTLQRWSFHLRLCAAGVRLPGNQILLTTPSIVLKNLIY